MSMLDNFFIIDAIDGTSGGYSCRVRLNGEHVIYRAHFPEDPITPGACLVRMAGKVFARCLGRPIALRRAATVKFIHVLRPNDVGVLSIAYTHLEAVEDGCSVRIVIADEKTVYAKMSLFFTYTSVDK